MCRTRSIKLTVSDNRLDQIGAVPITAPTGFKGALKTAGYDSIHLDYEDIQDQGQSNP